MTPAEQLYDTIIGQAKTVVPTLKPEKYETNDDDNARLFVDLFNGHVRHEAVNGQFMFFDGSRWRPDAWQIAPALAGYVARVRQQWLGEVDPRDLKEAARFVQRTRTAGGVRSMLYLAGADPRIATTIEEYDTDGYLLNTPGGTVDLRTGELHPHNPKQLITKITAFTPTDGPGELWPYVLNTASQGRADWMSALQRIIGSGAVGVGNKDKAAIAHGSGANLKDTTVETAAHVLGGYAANTSISTLMEQRRSSGHSEEIAQVRGVRFLRTAEPAFHGRLDEGRFKELTGGGEVSASHKHGRQFAFTPTFTLVISTNHKPKILGNDTGIWRRIWLFPYDYTIPEAERDPRFKDRLLETDGGAILTWIIEGARQFITSGWGTFPTIEAATAGYRHDQDIIGRFIEERCTTNPALEIRASRLREVYEKWCDDTGDRPFSGRAFRDAMEEKGYTQKKRSSGLVWLGIGEAEEGSDDDPF